MSITGKICKHSDFKDQNFKDICSQLKEKYRVHRELWAYKSIINTFDEIGLLEKDRIGLGFLEDTNPLCSYFALKGCNVVGATLLKKNKIWEEKNFNTNKICPNNTFYSNVKIFPMDFKKIHPELQNGVFDFIWGINPFIEFITFPECFHFIQESLKCLKLNGYACFVVDYNCLSNDITIDNKQPLIFRKKDIETIAKLIEPDYKMFPIDYDLGDSAYDYLIDLPPYKQNNHVKLYIQNHVVSSLFFIIQRMV